MDLKDFAGLAGVPIVIALVEACKRWVQDERWWPPLAIVWGVVLNLALAYILHTEYPTAVVVGVVTGLAGAGLYDSRRTVQPRRETPHG